MDLTVQGTTSHDRESLLFYLLILRSTIIPALLKYEIEALHKRQWRILARYRLQRCQECWKTSPQRYHVMRLGRTSWQESDQLENFDRRSKFLEISSTTYIEISNAQSFSPNNLISTKSPSASPYTISHCSVSCGSVFIVSTMTVEPSVLELSLRLVLTSLRT